MFDLLGREINYMRISVTDLCNLRCKYCMPADIEKIPMHDILTYEEIVRVVAEAASLGISKIKLTGGEPLVRRGLTDLVKLIKDIDGIEQVTLTTNGVLLKERMKELVEAGIDAINISLDTTDRDKYQEITGFDEMDKVMAGINEALLYPVNVKINSVLLEGINDKDVDGLVELAKNLPLSVRFIEMMPIGYGANYKPISNDKIQMVLSKKYKITQDTNVYGNGPAQYIKIDGFEGRVGFISAIHGKFCDACNRIRLTSTGMLKPCLCFGDFVDLRSVLRGENKSVTLKEAIKKAIDIKPVEHHFENKKDITETSSMVKIGG